MNETVDTEDKLKGLVLRGNLERKSIAFCITCSIETNIKKLESSTIVGAPEESYFRPIYFDENFPTIQEELVDIKSQLNRENRDFYFVEATDLFQKLIENNISEIADLLVDQEIENLNNFLLDILQEEFAKPDLQLKTFDLEEASSESEEKLEETEETPESLKDVDDTVITISPVIDAISGKSIETLNPGQSIFVQLSERHSDLFGLEYDDENPPVLKAEFLEYFWDPSTDEGGQLVVQIQEGIKGKATVPRGTKISTSRGLQQAAEAVNDIENPLIPFIFLALFLLVIVILFLLLLEIGGV